MAVFPPLKVTVCSDDRELPEYDDSQNPNKNDPTEKSTKIYKYVEAVQQKNFSIELRVTNASAFMDNDRLQFKVFVDGNLTNRPLLKQSHPSSREDVFRKVLGKGYLEGGKWLVRPFRFGSLKTTETHIDGDVRKAAEEVKDLGTIKVEVWRANTIKSTSPIHKLDPSQHPTSVESVSEKLLKGKVVDLSARLDDPVSETMPSFYQVENIDSTPWVSFHFKYRSTEALKKQGIIERTPSPPPLETRPIDSLTIEEARELLRKQRAQLEIERTKPKPEPISWDEQLRTAAKRSRALEDGADNVDDVTEVEPPTKKTHREVEVVELSDGD